jgi:hypothetical protein
MPNDNHAENLEKLQEALDAVQEAQDAADTIDDITDQLSDLQDRLDDARTNPASLDADTYADLALDLMLVIPNNLPLPEGAKKAIEALASVLASFIQGATGLALTLLARRFRQALQTEESPQEAARVAAGTRAEQSWLLTQYRLGLVTETGDRRDVKTPTEWLRDKLKGLIRSVLGGLIGAGPVRPRGGLVAVLALVLIGAIVFGAFGGGGDAGGSSTDGAASASSGSSPSARAVTPSSSGGSNAIGAAPEIVHPCDVLTAEDMSATFLRNLVSEKAIDTDRRAVCIFRQPEDAGGIHVEVQRNSSSAGFLDEFRKQRADWVATSIAWPNEAELRVGDESSAFWGYVITDDPLGRDVFIWIGGTTGTNGDAVLDVAERVREAVLEENGRPPGS